MERTKGYEIDWVSSVNIINDQVYRIVSGGCGGGGSYDYTLQENIQIAWCTSKWESQDIQFALKNI